jgi:hypothetical protein
MNSLIVGGFFVAVGSMESCGRGEIEGKLEKLEENNPKWY